MCLGCALHAYGAAHPMHMVQHTMVQHTSDASRSIHAMDMTKPHATSAVKPRGGTSGRVARSSTHGRGEASSGQTSIHGQQPSSPPLSLKAMSAAAQGGDAASHLRRAASQHVSLVIVARRMIAKGNSRHHMACVSQPPCAGHCRSSMSPDPSASSSARSPPSACVRPGCCSCGGDRGGEGSGGCGGDDGGEGGNGGRGGEGGEAGAGGEGGGASSADMRGCGLPVAACICSGELTKPTGGASSIGERRSSKLTCKGGVRGGVRGV